MTKLAYRRSIVIALIILYISTRVGWVIGPMPPLLYSHENGPFPTVNTDGWAPRLVQTGRKRENFWPPMGGPNPKVQPIASHHNIQAISLPSHTEGDGMNVAHRRGKIMKISFHEDLCDTYFTYKL